MDGRPNSTLRIQYPHCTVRLVPTDPGETPLQRAIREGRGQPAPRVYVVERDGQTVARITQEQPSEDWRVFAPGHILSAPDYVTFAEDAADWVATL